MILYWRGYYDDINMKSCRINDCGVFQFFESVGSDYEPLVLWFWSFDSIPIIWVCTGNDDDVWVTFSFAKIPDILSKEIRVSVRYVDSLFYEDINVFSPSNYVEFIDNGFHHPLQGNNKVDYSNASSVLLKFN